MLAASSLLQQLCNLDETTALGWLTSITRSGEYQIEQLSDIEYERLFPLEYKTEIMIQMRLYFVKLTREHPQMPYEEKYELCKVKCGEDLRRLKLANAIPEKRRKLEEMPEIADGSGAGSSMCD